MNLRIGTRDSKLALAQTELVCKELMRVNPSLSASQFNIVKIKTIGDKIQNKNLIDIGGKNLFIKELEQALLEKEIDFAVHSLKDMTANLNDRFTIAACLEREDPRDAFVSYRYNNIDELPKGAIIGTSSVRRHKMILNKRSDLQIVPFRGNVQTRLEKLKQNQVAASFLAMAGLKRLSIEDSIYTPLDFDEFLPAISQGVIGVECLKDNTLVYEILRRINHKETEIVTKAERAFLECLEADCSLPIAGYASIKDNLLEFRGLVINSKDQIFQDRIIGPISEADNLGYSLGLKLKPLLLS
jgi:hydroxymethylbilane synthase